MAVEGVFSVSDGHRRAATPMEGGVFHGGAGNKALAAGAAMTLLPEFDDKFVVPRSNAYEGVFASARNFLSQATPQSALLIGFGQGRRTVGTSRRHRRARGERHGWDEGGGRVPWFCTFTC